MSYYKNATTEVEIWIRERELLVKVGVAMCCQPYLVQFCWVVILPIFGIQSGQSSSLCLSCGESVENPG